MNNTALKASVAPRASPRYPDSAERDRREISGAAPAPELWLPRGSFQPDPNRVQRSARAAESAWSMEDGKRTQRAGRAKHQRLGNNQQSPAIDDLREQARRQCEQKDPKPRPSKCDLQRRRKSEVISCAARTFASRCLMFDTTAAVDSQKNIRCDSACCAEAARSFAPRAGPRWRRIGSCVLGTESAPAQPWRLLSPAPRQLFPEPTRSVVQRRFGLRDTFERAQQRARLAREFYRRRVRVVLALPRRHHRDQLRENQRESGQPSLLPHFRRRGRQSRISCFGTSGKDPL